MLNLMHFQDEIVHLFYLKKEAIRKILNNKQKSKLKISIVNLPVVSQSEFSSIFIFLGL